MTIQSYNGSQDSRVASTTNYGQFRLDPRNRPISLDHVVKLHDAIKEKNMLHAYPILVDNNMVVLDGQHRLLAAKALGVPVYFIQTDTATIQDIADINVLNMRWTKEDSMHYWCEAQHPEYVKLKTFHARNPWLSLSQAIPLCHKGNAVGLSRRFAMGQYTCNNLEHAERVVRMILDFKEVGIEFWSHRSFVSAMANLADNVDYEHAKMMDKLKYLSTKMARCPDAASYVEMINGIYNYRNQNQVLLKMINSADRRRRGKQSNKLD